MENLARQLFANDHHWQTDVITYQLHQDWPRQEKFLDYQQDTIGTIYRLPAQEILADQFALPSYRQRDQLLKQLKKQQPHYDLVISNTRFFDNSWWAPRVAQEFGAKSVLIDHCAAHPTSKNKLVTKIAKVADRTMSHRINQQYDLVLAITDSTRQFLCQLGFHPDETIVYNHVDDLFFTAQQCPKITDRVIISYAARLIESKNPILALNAAAAIVEQFPQTEFHFAGSGPLAKELQAVWQKLNQNQQQRLKLRGDLSRPEIAQLLWQSQIFIYPTDHSEGLPTTVLEAGFCANAVITTARGDLTQIIHHGQTGTIIKPNQTALVAAISNYLENPSQMKTEAANLRQEIEKKYTLTKTAQTFRQIITEKFPNLN